MNKKKIGALMMMAIVAANTPMVYVSELKAEVTGDVYFEIYDCNVPGDVMDGEEFDVEVVLRGDFSNVTDEDDVEIELIGSCIAKMGHQTTPATFRRRNTNDEETNYRFFVINNVYTYSGNNQIEVKVTVGDETKSSFVNIDGKAKPEIVTAAEGIEISTNIINAVVGENQQIAIDLKNVAEKRVEGGILNVELENNATGISVKRPEVKFSSIAEGDTATVYTILNIDEDVTQGIHNLVVSIEDGPSAVVPVKVASSFMPASFEITTANATNFEKDKPQQININFTNIGQVAAQNVKVELVQTSNVLIMDHSNVKYINNIEPMATQSLTALLQVNSVEEASIPMQVRMMYINDFGEPQTDEQYIYLTTVPQVEAEKLKNLAPPSFEILATNTTDFMKDVAKNISIKFKNVGESDADNVKIEIVPNENVYIKDGSNVRYLNSIVAGAEKSLEVLMEVNNQDVLNIPLEIKAAYAFAKYDDEGDEVTETGAETQYIYLTAVKEAEEPAKREISIGNIAEPSGIWAVGEPFNVSFDVYAPDGAENLKLSVMAEEGIVPKSKNLFMINEIAPETTNRYLVTFQALDSIKTNTYPIEIKTEYMLNEEEVTYSQYATVSVENNVEEEEEEEETKGGVPKVIIGEYTIDPVVVRAGEEFVLNVGFLNTHKEKNVSNFKANLMITEQGEDNTGSVFTPIGGSNTFFIDQMDPGQTVSKMIRMYTIPSATPKTYEVSMNMEYEDDDGAAISATEYLGIPVEQVTKLDIADVEMEMVEVGMEGDLTAQIFNKGKTIISNVEITTSGEGFDVIDNKQIIGRLDIGQLEYYEPTIIPNEEGILHGVINIEFEDVTGKVQNIAEEFEFEVMAAYVPEPYFPEENFGFEDFENVVEEVEEEVDILPNMVGLCAGFSVSALITKFFAVRKRKKIFEMGMDDDED